MTAGVLVYRRGMGLRSEPTRDVDPMRVRARTLVTLALLGGLALGDSGIAQAACTDGRARVLSGWNGWAFGTTAPPDASCKKDPYGGSGSHCTRPNDVGTFGPIRVSWVVYGLTHGILADIHIVFDANAYPLVLSGLSVRFGEPVSVYFTEDRSPAQRENEPICIAAVWWCAGDVHIELEGFCGAHPPGSYVPPDGSSLRITNHRTMGWGECHAPDANLLNGGAAVDGLLFR